MARNLNRASLIGHLGGDPVIHKSESGVIARVSLATSYSYKSSKTGEKINKTEWHRLVFFGKLGEVAQQYLHKGDKILAEGPLRTQEWTDKEGIKRYTTEIHVNNMEMLGSPSGKSEPKEDVNPYQPVANTESQETATFNYQTPMVEDDDIPF